ncbi:MAG: hypothetical protein M1402_02385 [Candidatus Thermoplasmatota archaeon]|nr:hypothetical protein [Candidatus Thermoplasmatota archaeon]
MSYFFRDRVGFWVSAVESWIREEKIEIGSLELEQQIDGTSKDRNVRLPANIKFGDENKLIFYTDLRSPYKDPWIYIQMNGSGLLKVNGEVVSGIDENHREVQLKCAVDDYIHLVLEIYRFRSNAYQMEYSDIKQLFLFKKNSLAENVFYDLYVLHEAAFSEFLETEFKESILASLVRAIKPLYDCEPDYDAWKSYVEHAENRADLESLGISLEQGDEKVIHKVPRHLRMDILRTVKKKLSSVFALMNTRKRPDGSILFTGHSHLDLAWLWTYDDTKKKISVTIASQLFLLEKIRGWKFTVTQPQLWEYLREGQPELFNRFIEMIKAKRIFPVETLWVEIEGQMPDAESVIRQLTLGNCFSQEYLEGRESKIVFLPDSFGYAYGLSNLLRSCGVEAFFTAKLYPGDTSNVPHRDFMWGTSMAGGVRTHIFGVKGTAFNGTATLQNILSAWKAYTSDGGTGMLLYTFGFGDGGGGPSYDMLHRIKRYRKMNILPEIIMGDPSYFMTRNNADLPYFDGDIYMRYNRGIYTTDLSLKSELRIAEQKLLTYELWMGLVVQNSLSNSDSLWKSILRGHFHDIISGTVIDKVSVQVRNDVRETEKCLLDVKRILTKYFRRKEEFKEHFVVLNTAPMRLNEFTFSIRSRKTILLYRDNRKIPATRISSNILVFRDRDIPAFGAAIYSHSVDPTPSHDIRNRTSETEEETLDWREFTIKLNACGISITRRMDNKPWGTGRIKLYWHHTDRNDAWALDPEYPDHEIPCTHVTVRNTFRSDHLNVFTIERNYKVGNFTETIKIDSYLPFIDISVKGKFSSRHVVVRYHFKTAYKSTGAYGDAMGTIMEQPVCEMPFGDSDKFEWCSQNFALSKGKDIAVALFNRGSYGFSVTSESISTTLVTTPLYPSPLTEAKGFNAGIGIYPALEESSFLDILRDAYSFNHEALVFNTDAQHSQEISGTYSPVLVRPENVMLVGSKSSFHGGSVIHLLEVLGSEGVAEIETPLEVTAAYIVNPKDEKRKERLHLMKLEKGKTRITRISFHYVPHTAYAVELDIATAGRTIR